MGSGDERRPGAGEQASAVRRRRGGGVRPPFRLARQKKAPHAQQVCRENGAGNSAVRAAGLQRRTMRAQFSRRAIRSMSPPNHPSGRRASGPRRRRGDGSPAGCARSPDRSSQRTESPPPGTRSRGWPAAGRAACRRCSSGPHRPTRRAGGPGARRSSGGAGPELFDVVWQNASRIHHHCGVFPKTGGTSRGYFRSNWCERRLSGLSVDTGLALC